MNYPAGVIDADIDRTAPPDEDLALPRPLTSTAWTELRDYLHEMTYEDVRVLADMAAAEGHARMARENAELDRMEENLTERAATPFRKLGRVA